MRLFTFKHTPRNGEYDIKENRWAFDVTFQFRTGRSGVFFAVGFYCEVVWIDNSVDPIACDWYELSFNPDWWALGRSMLWYDGPHNSISMGPLHFNYRDWRQSIEDEKE